MKETLAYLESFVTLALVLTGLAGLAYNLFKDGGWLEKLLGNAFSYAMQYPLIIIFMVTGAIVLARWWRHDRMTRGHKRLAPTIVLYVIMASGVYFIGHFALYGTL
jgi:hypothetical protein